jgi:heme-degrading monooxygenase HmoA
MPTQKVVVVFRSRLIPGTESEIQALGMRMYQFASEMPGFISYKDFSAEDGEAAAIVEFDSLESLAAWRDHPEHLLAKERGKREFFSEYQIQICPVLKEYGASGPPSHAANEG